MDAELNPTGGLGRPPKATMVEIVRELGPDDVRQLGKGIGSKPSALKRITETHHLIARLMAQGEAGYAIADATGYSQSRLSILKGDPAFQELIAHYRGEVEEVRAEHFVNTTAKLVAIRNDTLDAIHDKVLDEDLPLRDLREIAEMSMDRTGYGPQSKTQNTNLNINYAEQIAAARPRALEQTARIPIAKAARFSEVDASGAIPVPSTKGED